MAKAILLLDDAQGSLGPLAAAVQSAGYAATVVRGAAQAVSRFAGAPAELVFISLRADSADDVCEQIRDNPDGAIVPILFVGTGEEEIKTPSAALARGADYYFSHPLDLPKVLAKLQTYIGPGSRAAGAIPTPPAFDPITASATQSTPGPAPISTSLSEPGSGLAVDSLLDTSTSRVRDDFAPLPEFDWLKTSQPPAAAPSKLTTASDAVLAAIADQEAGVLAAPAIPPPPSIPDEPALDGTEASDLDPGDDPFGAGDDEEARRFVEEATMQAAEAPVSPAPSRAERAPRETPRQAEQMRWREAQEQAAREAEERAQQEFEEQVKREAEEKARQEIEEMRRRDLQAKAARDAQERSRRQAELPPAAAATPFPPRTRALPATPQPSATRPPRDDDPQDASSDPSAVADNAPTGILRTAKPAGRTGLVALSPAEGILSTAHDAASVLFSVWTQQATGRIDFISDPHRKSLYVENGLLIALVSTQPSDRMEEYLLREAKITRAQYQNVRSRSLEGSRRIGSYLVTEGYLKPGELFPSVQGHLVDMCVGLFEWESGSYHYLPERATDDSRVAIDRETPALVVEGIRRKHGLPRLINRVGAPSSLVSLRQINDRERLALGLDEAEVSVLRLFDGTRSIEDVVFATGMGLLRVYQVLGAMSAMGLVQVSVRGAEGVDVSGASAGDNIDRQRIHEKVEQVRDQDYFQIVGVPANATPYEIERACTKAIQEFAFERFSAPIRRKLNAELIEINDTLAQTRSVLLNDQLREAYARHLAA